MSSLPSKQAARSGGELVRVTWCTSAPAATRAVTGCRCRCRCRWQVQVQVQVLPHLSETAVRNPEAADHASDDEEVLEPPEPVLQSEGEEEVRRR